MINVEPSDSPLIMKTFVLIVTFAATTDLIGGARTERIASFDDYQACASAGRAWPFVELTSHLVQISLRMHRQVGPLREVLPQQSIGIFIRTALPRTLRIASLCLLD